MYEYLCICSAWVMTHSCNESWLIHTCESWLIHIHEPRPIHIHESCLIQVHSSRLIHMRDMTHELEQRKDVNVGWGGYD